MSTSFLSDEVSVHTEEPFVKVFLDARVHGFDE